PPVATSSARPGRRARTHSRRRSRSSPPRVAGARDVGCGARAELRLHAPDVGVAHVRLARSARWRKRKSESSGERSKRREASSTSFTRSAAGSSRSRSSIHFTACLIGASPAAIADLPSLLAARLPLELRLPLLVEVLDAGDVLDGGPR